MHLALLNILAQEGGATGGMAPVAGLAVLGAVLAGFAIYKRGWQVITSAASGEQVIMGFIPVFIVIGIWMTYQNGTLLPLIGTIFTSLLQAAGNLMTQIAGSF